MTTYSYSDLNGRYEMYTNSLRCECVLGTEMVGGQPADEDGVRAYVVHHLKIEDEKAREEAVRRILHEEVQNVTPPEGELPEGRLYGLRAVRKTNDGWPYLGNWMIKACLKQASSSCYVFQQLIGSKRCFSEAGRVRAWQYSLHDPSRPDLICLTNAEGTGPARTYYKEFMGRVQTPQGPVSIIHQSECVAPGSRFAYEFNFMPLKGMTEDVVRDILAMSQICGVGSARSLECGKFRIEHAEVELTSKPQYKVEKTADDINRRSAAN